VMEYLVNEAFEEILRFDKSYRGCRRCRLDTMAVALNKLPASYVITAEGEVLLRAVSLMQQFKVDVIKAVAESLELILKHPRHKE